MTQIEALAQNATLTVVGRAATILAAAMLTAMVGWVWSAGDRIAKLETSTAVIQATQAQSGLDRKEFQEETGATLNQINRSLVELSNSTAALNATVSGMARK